MATIPDALGELEKTDETLREAVAYELDRLYETLVSTPNYYEYRLEKDKKLWVTSEGMITFPVPKNIAGYSSLPWRKGSEIASGLDHIDLEKLAQMLLSEQPKKDIRGTYITERLLAL